MKKVQVFVVMLVVMILLVAGCAQEGVPVEPVNDQEEEAILPDQLPEEIETWIEDSKDQFAAQTYELEGILYLLVTYGEKPTGGFEVEITNIVVRDEKVEVTVEFTEPGEDDMVTQALTYPYDLAMLEDPGLPVEFIATGAESAVPVR